MTRDSLAPVSAPLRRASTPVFFIFTWMIAMTLPAENPTTAAKTQLATLGGGCFWCIEAVFENIPGVKAVTSGYAGGQAPDPTYEQVCSKTTGHAEVVQIEFDPAKVSYDALLKTFWKAHDPTTLNRQGADRGPQYRSIILFHDDTQRAAAEKSKKEAQPRYEQPIVTEIVPLKKFYPAEDYHQDYFRKNPHAGYCRVVIRPKLDKLEHEKVIPPAKP
jgi:peptide-methionine (S)-S-oxide reductase